MSGFIYYLPNDRLASDASSITALDVRDAGLAYAFEPDSNLVGRGVVCGPDGNRGVVFADARFFDVAKIGYHANTQQWRAIPPGRAWIGTVNDEPVTPEHLARTNQLKGHWLRLDDGNQWLIPVARGFSATDDGQASWYRALPQAITIDDDGNWSEAGVMPIYGELWDIAERWWDAIGSANTEGNTARFDFAGLNDAALTTLQANYRVSRIEVALLGIFNDQATRKILDALIDWPTMAEWIKKKMTTQESVAPDGSALCAGRVD